MPTFSSFCNFHRIYLFKFHFNIFLDFFAQIVKNVLNPLSSFCANFQKVYLISLSWIFLGQFLPLLIRNLPFRGIKITFVADNDLLDILICFLLHLNDPFFQINKCIPVIHGVYEHNTCSALIISLSDISIPFLTSSIPNLKPNFLIIHLNSLNFEIYTYGRDIIVLEILLSKLDDDIRLANTRISNDN